MKTREKKLNDIIRWAETNPDIRAVLLTSSLANPYAPVDDLSDLDIELILTDRNRYETEDGWIRVFGEPVCIIEESAEAFDGIHAMKMVLYSDHVKVDFKLYGTREFNQEVQSEAFPEDWDVGYNVLVDKDGIYEGSVLSVNHDRKTIRRGILPADQRLLVGYGICRQMPESRGYFLCKIHV